MRLRVLSDLHVERAPFEPLERAADAVVLAGDIHNGVEAILWARRTFPDLPVVFVPGNHEFYDGLYDEGLAQMREAAARCGVHLLENDVLVLRGVRFLGCTLWTDFAAFDVPAEQLPPGSEPMTVPQAMDHNRRLFADFRAIGWREEGRQRAFQPEDSVLLHARSRRWLQEQLSTHHDGPTVVVTHHLPTWRSVHPEFLTWGTNAGFVTRLDDLVAQADLWVHGHTHSTQDHAGCGTRVVCNPRGYPRRAGGFENPDFDPGLVVEVPWRAA